MQVDHADKPLANRFILIASAKARNFSQRLEAAGARIAICPRPEFHPPESYAALDESIENLYGYDWLVFINREAVATFLQRFRYHQHETAELDELKVCAIGERAAVALEEAQVHVDLVSSRFDSASVIASLAEYLGGTKELTGLSVLIPQATIGRHYLKDNLEAAGSRADVVAAYQTVAGGDAGLTRLRTLLVSDAFDCVLFAEESDVQDFVRLFDTNDLSPLLSRTVVFTLDNLTSKAIAEFGIRAKVLPEGDVVEALIQSIIA